VIARLGSALARTGALVLKRPAAAAWTMLALVAALFLAGAAGITAASIDRWADAHPGSGGALVVYLGDDVEPARAQLLLGELRALRGVERAELIPAAESARRLTRALGGDASLLDGIDPASLPASVEVTLAPGVRDVIAMSPTLRALRGAPGVSDVVVTAGGDDPIAGVLGTARDVAWTGAAVFAALALIIVLAAIRVRLERSPREAAVLALLGAPPSFAAIPSALAGALHGALAAVIAVFALLGVIQSLPSALAGLELALPSALALAGLVGLGAIVGLIGGALAGVSRAP